MGPCLWGTEDRDAILLDLPSLRGLQWGRACGARKTMKPLTDEIGKAMLQWGRACGARKTKRWYLI